jgi:NAD(P)-dependent dehydrogenase (short-subunit alcohol dehydrogenase family)
MERRLAVIAAAGPGMGLAVARRFAREGFDLALIARDAAALERHAAPLPARAYSADLTEEASVRDTFARIAAEQGGAEVLVFNAGAWHEGPAMATPPAAFHRDLMLCATAALACAQAVHPAMRERGRGTMLFTGGGLALRPEYGRGVASLTAGKSALRGLVHAMAAELAEDGIRAGTITIAGMVKPGTAFDPDRIAELYWRFHAGEITAVETVFDGTG